jgi:hypothetical protein
MVELRDCMHMQVSMAVNGFRYVNLKVFTFKIISNLCGLCPVFIAEYYFFIIIY